MDIERIISIVWLGLGIITFIAGMILRFAKSKKARAAAQSVIDSCVDVAALIKLIAEAESHTDYTGDNKRDYVIARYLKDHNMTVDDLSDVIATLVAFTKNVNTSAQAEKKIEECKNDARGTETICRIAR